MLTVGAQSTLLLASVRVLMVGAQSTPLLPSVSVHPSIVQDYLRRRSKSMSAHTVVLITGAYCGAYTLVLTAVLRAHSF